MIPYPVLDLTLEQQFQLRKFGDAADNASKQDLINLCTMLLRQNFMYNNTITNLVKNWNEADVQRTTPSPRHSPC
jgi:hypothetical protein